MVLSPSGLRTGVSGLRLVKADCQIHTNTSLLSDDGLSYCTWNGLGQNLTEDKVFTALESLSKNEINISNLIIDDNWQSLVSY
jgi:hypothetical protein